VHAQAQGYRSEAIENGDYISSVGYISGIGGVRTLQAVAGSYVAAPLFGVVAPSIAAVPGASLGIQGIGLVGAEELTRNYGTASYYAYQNGDYLESQEYGLKSFESAIDVGTLVHGLRGALPPSPVGTEYWRPHGTFDAFVQSSGQFGRDVSAWNLNRFRNNSTRYYHGTTGQFSESILVEGINTTIGRETVDFGQGFYVSQSQVHAASMSMRVADRLGSDAAVISFRVSNAELGKLVSKDFVSASPEWLAFVKSNRTPGTPLHGFDLVSGPVVGNLRTYAPLPFPEYNQTSIHTTNAANLFDGSIKRLIR
jgi:hypothetical protein